MSCVAVRIATFKFVLQENIHSRHIFLEMRHFDFSHWPEYMLEYTDSSDADLFRLIFRDLSTGGLVRQHRETDWQGNFLAKPTRKGSPLPKGAPRMMKSAFDDGEQYELTALGEQFVHYAMTDIPPKIEFKEAS